MSLLVLITTLPAAALVVHRTVSIEVTKPWRDVTSAIAASLPPLPHALATVRLSPDAASRLAVADPALLEVGPASIVLPQQKTSVAIGVRDGIPLLPEGARILLLRSESCDDGDEALDLHVTVEAAEPLLTSPPGPSRGAAIALAALRTALGAQGTDAATIAELEAETEPSPAGRVLESFVGKEHRAEALLPAARRAAHHIGHLLREQAASRAEYLRNNDAAVAARAATPAFPLTLVLDNVRSAYNVGSLFRTADTARCEAIITCGFTPHPPHPKLAKTAFGALDSVPTTHEESTLHAVRALQRRGVRVYAMETTARSVNYCAAAYPRAAAAADQEGGGGGGVALVLGNEQIGVDTQVMAAVDGLLEIPTFGTKNSLNVASAGAIVIYEVLRSWGALAEGAHSEGGASIRGE